MESKEKISVCEVTPELSNNLVFFKYALMGTLYKTRFESKRKSFSSFEEGRYEKLITENGDEN